MRKSTFFIGLLIVTNLILLGGCGGCGKEKTETPQQKLEKEEKRLINEIAQKLNLTDQQKEEFSKRSQVSKQSTLENEKNKLGQLKQAQPSLSTMDDVMVKQVANVLLAQLGFKGVNFTGDTKAAQELIGLAISLQENLIEQIELKDKAKK